MHDRGRGAARSRAAERRCRAARGHIGLQAWNALIGRIGLLRLLAHDHAVIRAAEHARDAFEAEWGALRERDFGRCGQGRCNNARYGHASWHRLSRSGLRARARVAATRKPTRWFRRELPSRGRGRSGPTRTGPPRRIYTPYARHSARKASNLKRGCVARNYPVWSRSSVG
jgi:hypothetical protein